MRAKEENMFVQKDKRKLQQKLKQQKQKKRETKREIVATENRGTCSRERSGSN